MHCIYTNNFAQELIIDGQKMQKNGCVLPSLEMNVRIEKVNYLWSSYLICLPHNKKNTVLVDEKNSYSLCKCETQGVATACNSFLHQNRCFVVLR